MDIKATVAAPSAQAPGVRSPIRKIRVLIADDEFHVRQVVAGIVRALGAVVVAEAGDGDEAVEAFGRLRPDMVILDINMPRMRGDEALTRILAIDPQVVAIMMTAQDTIDSVHECLDRGARHYILKSNRAEEILQLLAECWPDCIAHVRSVEAK
jgi:DNA-binding NarL/FixJ family response regulator